jgi:HSP20 family protein
MSTDLTKFDILFRDIFNNSNSFNFLEGKQPHPLNIYYDDDGLHFQVACTGLTKKDVQLDIEDDTLKIIHEKEEDRSIHPGTIHRGLSQKSFKLAYKISSKYDLSKTEAKLENGLLEIDIPLREESKPKTIKIK